MQNARRGESQPDSQNDHYRSVVSNLVSLIEHLKASTKLLELAIARETASGGQEPHDNVVVLDDVTPCYLRANAALNACNAGLAAALHSLLDANASKSETAALIGSDRDPAGLAGCA
jgi:hypothetical protein